MQRHTKRHVKDNDAFIFDVCHRSLCVMSDKTVNSDKTVMWPGFDSRLGVIFGFSLVVLFSALRGFSPGNPVVMIIDFNLQCPRSVLQND